ncbi:MAG: aminotransferase class III-fold pyridoxal phosphate-dependent enzyme [Anaerolineaceae bacterium]|nr:aminotransferase class III-fold pyridoxal phosphate-dependent enzyme [Anaerolineaceae bacterium]
MIEVTDNEILPLSLVHNFWTWSAQAYVDPIAVKKAKGVYFWDVEGKRYLDFNSMVMCVNIGHGDDRIAEAIARQARELSFASPRMATRPRAILGKMMEDITPPGLSKFLYTLGGSEANENAIKLARAYTGKDVILTRFRSYHGATHGSISLTGDPRRHACDHALMPGVVHFLDPYRYRSTFHRMNPDISDEDFCLDYLNHLEEIIMYEGHNRVAAILLETVTGTNGVIIPPDGYLEGVREICDKNNILMICDEVMAGFGRTGKWFAVNHWNVIPDIITMAKGLTSGYAPLGAVAMKKEIAAAFDEKVFSGGMTYNGHPVLLAAAIANIEIIKSDNLLENSTKVGLILAKYLQEMKKRHPSVGDVRSIGLFGVIELVRDRKTKEPMAPFNGKSPEMKALLRYCLDHGLFIYTHWHKILIIPPLIITEEQLKVGFDILDRALEITDASAKSFPG